MPADGLAVDADHIAVFARAVFHEGTRGTIAVRCFCETVRESHRSWTPFIDPNQQLVGTLVRYAKVAAEDGRSCCVVPGFVVDRRARASDVAATGVVLVDLDQGNVSHKRAHLVHHLGLPTLEVASGGVTAEGQARLHLYWRLADVASGSDVQRVCAMRDAIAMKVGGDRSFRSPHQPIRVPGSIYLKGGVARIVQVVRQSPQTDHLAELERAIEAMPALADDAAAHVDRGSVRVSRSGSQEVRSQPPSAGDPTRFLDFNHISRRCIPIDRLQSMTVRENGVDGITRYEALSRVIGYFVRQVRIGQCSEAMARQMVRSFNSSRIIPPWSDERLAREFDAIRRRDVMHYGSAGRRRDGGAG